MTELYPEKNPRDAWNVYFDRIHCLVKDSLTRMSGPTGCDKHYSAVMDKMQEYFLSNFSESIRMPDPVQSGSAKVRSSTKRRKTPGSEAFWRKLSIPRLVDGVVEDFVMLERKRLWEAHKADVISNLQEALPAAARQFETHYTEFFLSKFVSRWFNYWFPEGRSTDQLEEWLKHLLKEVVATEIPKLVNDKGELRDEELVRLYRAGFPNCKTLLLERYQTKLRQLTPAIVHSKALCPESEDPDQFDKDVAQDVAVKLLTKVDSYRFESSFATWVSSICENEAKTRRDKLIGRSEKGKRKYVSFDELLEQSATPPVIKNLVHRDILHKVFAKHRTQGTRAAKSTDAVELRHFGKMDSEHIAERLQTTLAYLYQLFSHDYRELRRICLEDFGISGTDL
jgi:DNA-directed RNA polymerase specialized sigma24 family protein